MSRPTPRRPSRTTTPRPRKIAGRVEGADEESARPSTTDAADAPAATPPKPPRPPRRPVSRSDDDGPAPADETGGRTSTILALIGLLVLLLLLQCGWFVWNALRDEAVSATSAAVEREDGAPIAVPSGKPVVLNQLAVQEGVEAAAAAAESMFARNWKSYDEGVDSAVALMTEDFAEQFRATTADVRQEFVRKKTEVQVRVVAQSVVRANEAELEALIFLNQYVFRGEGDDAKTTYTPYRALLTMVHTDQGWLVDGVQTR